MRSVVQITISIFLLLPCFPSISSAHEYNPEGWEKASKFLHDAMDKRKQPCRDFYGFACKKLVNNQLGKADNYVRQEEIDLRDAILASLESLNRKTSVSTPEYKNRLRVMFDQCKAQSALTDEEVLSEIFQSYFDGNTAYWARPTHMTTEDVWMNIGYLERTFMTHVLIEAGVYWIISNAWPILKLSYPSQPYLKASKTQLIEVMKAYVAALNRTVAAHNISLAELFAARNISFGQQELYDYDGVPSGIINFERNLTQLLDAQRERQVAGTIMKFSELQKKYPSVAWNAYITGLFTQEWANAWKRIDPLVMVIGDYYFKSLPALIKKHNFQNIDDFGFMKSIYQIKEFHKYKTSGGLSAASSPEAKKAFCFEVMKAIAPSAVARMYFDVMKVDVVRWRNDVDLIAYDVLAAFRVFVRGQDWLEEQDQMTIINRINKMRIYTGIPSWLANDTEVNSRTHVFGSGRTLVQDVLNAYFVAHIETFKELFSHAPIEPSPKLTIGVEYSYGEIHVNLGQLLPPYYHVHYPLAVKFGVLGWLIGHELMHGFDEASLSKELNLGQSWLQPDVEEMFHKRKRCIVQQYSKFCYKDLRGECLSGVKTLNANIGDMEGLKIAYMAYKFVTQTVGPEPPLPGMVNMSNDHVFFISAAQLHCGRPYDFRIDRERVPPNKARIEQSLRNFPVFAKTFECKRGSKYSPLRACSLWGRFIAPC